MVWIVECVSVCIYMYLHLSVVLFIYLYNICACVCSVYLLLMWLMPWNIRACTEQSSDFSWSFELWVELNYWHAEAFVVLSLMGLLHFKSHTYCKWTHQSHTKVHIIRCMWIHYKSIYKKIFQQLQKYSFLMSAY